MTEVVLQLFPSLTDVNGDAQNALVLARRAVWAGLEATVLPLEPDGELAIDRPSIVVLGSGVDSALPATLYALLRIADRLRGWSDDGVPMLAVGTGMELLGRRVRTASDDLEGLGLLPGETETLAARVTGDLVVDTSYGRLVGYENHARAFRLDPGTREFGTVVRGAGDTRGVDGVRHGAIVGTRLHGPVLAKNPGFADALLAAAVGRAVVPAAAEAIAADAAAAAIRDRLLAG